MVALLPIFLGFWDHFSEAEGERWQKGKCLIICGVSPSTRKRIANVEDIIIRRRRFHSFGTGFSIGTALLDGFQAIGKQNLPTPPPHDQVTMSWGSDMAEHPTFLFLSTISLVPFPSTFYPSILISLLLSISCLFPPVLLISHPSLFAPFTCLEK